MGRSPLPTDGSHPHDDRPDLERLDPTIGLTAGALLDPRSCQARSRPWTTRSDLETQSASPEGQHHYLLGGLARAAERSGLVLGPSQSYDDVVPPILGGAFAVENITVADFAVTARAPTKRPNKPPGQPDAPRLLPPASDGCRRNTCRYACVVAPSLMSFGGGVRCRRRTTLRERGAHNVGSLQAVLLVEGTESRSVRMSHLESGHVDLCAHRR